MIDLRADAEGLELGAVQNRNRTGDGAGLLHPDERVHERFKGAGFLEVDEDDAAVAAGVVGRLDSLDHRVGRTAGRKLAGFGVLIGLLLPPRFMQQRSKEALRVADLDLAAAQGNGQIVVQLVEARLVVAGADDQEVAPGALPQRIGVGRSDP
jgi:hypothetical protein